MYQSVIRVHNLVNWNGFLIGHPQKHCTPPSRGLAFVRLLPNFGDCSRNFTYVCSPWHIIPSVLSSVLRALLFWSHFSSLSYLSVVLSLSFSLPHSRDSPARLGGSLSLSFSLFSFSFFFFSLSFALANRTSNSLLSPNTPPILSLSLSPTRLWWISAPCADVCDIRFNLN